MTDQVLKEIIVDCIKKRAQAKELELEAKVLRKEADLTLTSYREDGTITGDKFEAEGIGRLTFIQSTRSKTDLKLFKEKLMLAGVEVGVISKAETESTTTTPSTSIRFTPEKKTE